MIQCRNMTSRFSPYSNVPEELGAVNRKGLQTTKSTIEDFPGVRPLLHSVHNNYSYNSTPTNSGRTSPALTDQTTPGLYGLQGGWITGNSTERSSLGSSYSLDDIDRQASCMVTKHFDIIKSVLFEGEDTSQPSPRTSSSLVHKSSNTSQSDTLKECQEWRAQFHHLRVLGTQVRDPQSSSTERAKDCGYQYIAMETTPNSTPRQDTIFDVTDGTSDPTLVHIIGRGILPKHPPTEATSVTTLDHDINNGFEFLREEIFAQDGVYEEVIALDDERIEGNVEPKVTVRPSRRRIGYPPITPNACISNSVMSRLFDGIWANVIIWIWPAIQKEYPSFDDVISSSLDVNPSSPHQNNPSPASRQPSFTFTNAKHPYLNQRANTHVGGLLDSQKSFDGILQISRIPINTRDTIDGASILAGRPGSSIQSRQRPTTTSRYSKMAGRGSRLPPLYTTERSKEEEIIIDALHVKKLTPHNTVDSISPTPLAYIRNGALPPIPLEKERKGFTSNRASSAVDNKEARMFPTSHRAYLPSDQRPSTTHAMRTDMSTTILRRSSTPQNKPHLIGKPLNVTGSGLQPSSEFGNIMEDPEGSIVDGNLHNNHWPTASLSNNNPYRRRFRHLLQT